MVDICLKHFGWTRKDTAEIEAELLRHVFRSRPPIDPRLAAEANGTTGPVNELDYKVFDVALPDGRGTISTLHVRSFRNVTSAEEIHNDKKYQPMDPTSTSTTPILLIHGFAAGKALWYNVLTRLASLEGSSRDIYAIDLPGMACSSPFSKADKGHWLKTVKESANLANNANALESARQLRNKALDYYSNALEAWMISLQLPKVLLIGHSLGIPTVFFG